MANAAMTFQYDDVGTVKKIIIDWLSDDGGAASAFDTKKISGFLLKGVTNPADGADQPDDNYNLSLTDPEGGNILGNCAANLLLRDDTLIQTVDFIIRDLAAADACGSGERPCVSDVITVNLSAAGNALQGRFILYWMGSV